jgi:cell division protein FtsB
MPALHPALNPLRWKKSFLISIMGLFLVVWFGFLDTYSIYTRFQLERERRDLIRQTELLVEQTAELKLRIQALENNPALLERIAREEYGMRRPGETIYRIRQR